MPYRQGIRPGAGGHLPGQWLDVRALGAEGVGEQSGQRRVRQRAQRQRGDRVPERTQRGGLRRAGGEDQQVPDRRTAEQRGEQVQARRIGEVQVVEDQQQRACRVGDLGDEPAHRELGTRAGVVRGKVRDRRPGAEHVAQRGDEVDERVRAGADRFHQPVGCGTRIEPGERGGHGGVRDVGFEGTGEHRPGYVCGECVEKRGLADARFAGQAYRRRLAAGGRPLVEAAQPGQPRLPAVEPVGEPEVRALLDRRYLPQAHACLTSGRYGGIRVFRSRTTGHKRRRLVLDPLPVMCRRLSGVADCTGLRRGRSDCQLINSHSRWSQTSADIHDFRQT